MLLDHTRVVTTPDDHARELPGTTWRVEDPRAYVRLAAMLREDIESGALAPGEPVPSITTLSQEHGYARKTIAHAFALLVDQGLVVRVPGLGYYVADR